MALLDLQNAFQNKIIPLLQEYFYGDYGKIGLVIGEKFFDENKRKFEFSKFPYDGKDELKDRPIYHLKNISAMEAMPTLRKLSKRYFRKHRTV
jgi:5-methylcytosine-specific restriction protein B